jgi:hypothetical protein
MVELGRVELVVSVARVALVGAGERSEPPLKS